MSLMKKRVLTEKQKAAARANGSRSRGFATAGGLARIRDAQLQHGLYSQSEEIVLTSLGETWEEFEKLRQAVREEFPLPDPRHQQLLEDLAVAEWRLRRFERHQEDMEIQQALETSRHQRWTMSTQDVDRSMSAEQGAFRDVARLIRLLMEVQEGKQKRLLSVTPQKLLKTRGELCDNRVKIARKER